MYPCVGNELFETMHTISVLCASVQSEFRGRWDSVLIHQWRLSKDLVDDTLQKRIIQKMKRGYKKRAKYWKKREEGKKYAGIIRVAKALATEKRNQEVDFIDL